MDNFEGYADLIGAIITQSRESDDHLWQDLKKSGLLDKKNINALEIMHWIVDYIDGPEIIDVKMSKSDFRKLVKFIEKLREDNDDKGTSD